MSILLTFVSILLFAVSEPTPPHHLSATVDPGHPTPDCEPPPQAHAGKKL